MNNLTRLQSAGLSKDEIQLCHKLWKDSGLKVSYRDWVTGYILLNGKPESIEPNATDGAIIGNALINLAMGGKLSKTKKNISIGSFKKH